MKMDTLQQIFGDKKFKIPDYQRGYSWEIEQLNDLLEDLELLQKGNKHYTGTIVIRNTKMKINASGESFIIYELVDGQQRITSIIILLNEIIKELRELKTTASMATADDIERIYIKKNGPQNSTYKLELDQDNNKYFEGKILENRFESAKTKSHHLLEAAKTRLSNYLQQKRNLLGKNYPIFLDELLNKITQGLGFTTYDVEDESEVGIIFESLNDRGKPLSKLEIVKNFLIYETSKISKGDAKTKLIKLINLSWKEILENLAAIDLTDNDDENEFLRHNYIMQFYSELKEEKMDGKRITINSQLADIHKLVKKYFKEAEKQDSNICYSKIEEYVRTLKDMSYKLKDLLKPNDAKFPKIKDIKKEEALREIISKFIRLKIQSNFRPLLISIYENYSGDYDKFINLFNLCEIALFRIYYIADHPSHTGQTKLYTLANKVYKKEIDYSMLIKEIIKIIDQYCASEKIGEKLLNIDNFYDDWDGLNYLLYELERKSCLDTPDKKPYYHWRDLEGKKKDDAIEHILPQTILGKDYWTSRFNTKAHENNLNKLGNLTLTSISANSKLRNDGFDIKKLKYKESMWRIQKNIGENFDNWTEKEITQRQLQLIDFIKTRWGIPQAFEDLVLEVNAEGDAIKKSASINLSDIQKQHISFFLDVSKRIKMLDPALNVSEPSTRYCQIWINNSNIHFEWSFQGTNNLEIALHSEEDENRKLIETFEPILEKITQATGYPAKAKFWNGKHKWTKVYIKNNFIEIDDKLIIWAVEKMKQFIDVIRPELEKLSLEK